MSGKSASSRKSKEGSASRHAEDRPGSSSVHAQQQTSSSSFRRVRVEDLLNDTSLDDQESAQSSRKESPIELAEIRCDYPGCLKVFPSFSTLQQHHRRSHARPTSFVCDKCQASFSTFPNLNKHVSWRRILVEIWFHTIPRAVPKRKIWNTVSQNDPYRYSTTICLFGKKIQKRAVHDKLKPFKCGLCSSDFAFRDGLQRHRQMVHENLRPHACEVCPMKFKTKAHLTKHMVSIHPESCQQRRDEGPSKALNRE